jgi:hypothetical protein
MEVDWDDPPLALSNIIYQPELVFFLQKGIIFSNLRK